MHLPSDGCPFCPAARHAKLHKWLKLSNVISAVCTSKFTKFWKIGNFWATDFTSYASVYEKTRSRQCCNLFISRLWMQPVIVLPMCGTCVRWQYINEFCRRTLQIRLVLWQKVTFHNSLNVKIFTNTYRKCWFADVILFRATVCSKFYTKCIITLHNGCMWLKESKNTENSHGKFYKQSND